LKTLTDPGCCKRDAGQEIDECDWWDKAKTTDRMTYTFDNGTACGKVVGLIYYKVA
jgi:hypothetical protein